MSILRSVDFIEQVNSSSVKPEDYLILIELDKSIETMRLNKGIEYEIEYIKKLEENIFTYFNDSIYGEFGERRYGIISKKSEPSINKSLIDFIKEVNSEPLFLGSSLLNPNVKTTYIPFSSFSSRAEVLSFSTKSLEKLILHSSDSISRLDGFELITIGNKIKLTRELDYLNKALKEQQLGLDIQEVKPFSQKDSSSSFNKGEVLVRDYSQGSKKSPSKLLEVAQYHNCSLELDRNIISLILKEKEKLFSQFNSLNINVSNQSFQNKEFMLGLSQLFDFHNIDPEKVTFEITEDVISRNIEHSYEVLEKLRLEGFKFALDDIGTGYNDLSRLAEFPVNFFKVDKSLISNMFTKPGIKNILEFISSYAQELDIKTVAEGIETQKEYDYLKSIGYTYSQGFFTGRPQTFISPKK